MSTSLLIRDGIPLTASALAVTTFVKLLDNRYTIFQFPGARQFNLGVLAMSIMGMLGREFALKASKKESPGWKTVYRVVGLGTGVAGAAFALSQKYFTPTQATVLAGLIVPVMGATDYYIQKSIERNFPIALEELEKHFEREVTSHSNNLMRHDLSDVIEDEFMRALKKAKYVLAKAERYGIVVKDSDKKMMENVHTYLSNRNSPDVQFVRWPPEQILLPKNPYVLDKAAIQKIRKEFEVVRENIVKGMRTGKLVLKLSVAHEWNGYLAMLSEQANDSSYRELYL